jgi:hypothetical protein
MTQKLNKKLEAQHAERATENSSLRSEVGRLQEQVDVYNKGKSKSEMINDLEARLAQMTDEQNFVKRVIDDMEKKLAKFSPEKSDIVTGMLESLKQLDIVPGTQELLKLIPQIHNLTQEVSRLDGTESPEQLENLRLKVCIHKYSNVIEGVK